MTNSEKTMARTEAFVKELQELMAKHKISTISAERPGPEELYAVEIEFFDTEDDDPHFGTAYLRWIDSTISYSGPAASYHSAY